MNSRIWSAESWSDLLLSDDNRTSLEEVCVRDCASGVDGSDRELAGAVAQIFRGFFVGFDRNLQLALEQLAVAGAALVPDVKAVLSGRQALDFKLAVLVGRRDIG